MGNAFTHGSDFAKKRLYGTATVGSKGQVVIPAEAREDLGLKPGDRLYVMNSAHGSGVVLLKEEMLEAFVEQISAQVEDFRAFKKTHDDK